MALATFNPPIEPSPGTSVSPTFKLKKAEFGDGYTQTTRDGLNHIKRVVQLEWETIAQAEAAQIVAFLDQMGGDTPFAYAVPSDVQRTWTCNDYSSRFLGAGRVSLSAKLEQNFNVIAP